MPQRLVLIWRDLLTEDLEASRPGGANAKGRAYDRAARAMHDILRGKLSHLTRFDAQGGIAWIMSEKPYDQYEQIAVLERELAKQIMVALC